MATTFNVFALGWYASIDPTEGNYTAENANLLVGETVGSVGDPLSDYILEVSPAPLPPLSIYNQDETEGATQLNVEAHGVSTFDVVVEYNATITYHDGSTDTITAVVFQDDNGFTFLAPEITANADQAALEAGPIQSITFDSIFQDFVVGLEADRQVGNFVCFASGVRVSVPGGETAVDALQEGDLVCTVDHGPQKIRWVGRSTLSAMGENAPVRIVAGSLGHGLPRRDLVISQQHRMLVCSRIAEKMFGTREVLVAAKKLTDVAGIEIRPGVGLITYYHLLFDNHELVLAEDTPTESLLTGPQAQLAIGREAMDDLKRRFPDIVSVEMRPARPIPKGSRVRQLVLRHQNNGQPLLHSFDALGVLSQT